MRNLKFGAAIVGIIIVATFLRVYHLRTTPPGLYPDEAVNALNAVTANKTGEYKVYYPDNNGREGLFMNIQAIFLKAASAGGYQYEPWMLRLPSALIGILTVIGIFFFAKELFIDRRIALLAAFFTATNVWHIAFSRIGFRAITAPFFLVWALALLLMAYRAGYLEKAKTAITFSILGGIMFGLGFYSYIAYRTAPLLLIPIAIYFRKYFYSWRILGTFLLTTFFVALPIGLYYLHHPADFFGRTSQVSVFSGAHPAQELALNTVKTIGMFLVVGDFNWRHNFAGAPALFWPVALCLIFGIVIAVKNVAHHIKQNPLEKPSEKPEARFSFIMLASWIVLAALPVVTSNEGLPHALRSILFIPPVMILAGLGGVMAYDFLGKRYPGIGLYLPTALLLSLLMFQAYNLYFVQWMPREETKSAFAADYTDMAHQIRATDMKDRPIYIIADGGGIDVNIATPWDNGVKSKVGFPLASQVVMFITDTFMPEDQYAKQIYYVLPGDKDKIPEGAKTFTVR